MKKQKVMRNVVETERETYRRNRRHIRETYDNIIPGQSEPEMNQEITVKRIKNRKRTIVSTLELMKRTVQQIMLKMILFKMREIKSKVEAREQ